MSKFNAVLFKLNSQYVARFYLDENSALPTQVGECIFSKLQGIDPDDLLENFKKLRLVPGEIEYSLSHIDDIFSTLVHNPSAAAFRTSQRYVGPFNGVSGHCYIIDFDKKRYNTVLLECLPALDEHQISHFRSRKIYAEYVTNGGRWQVYGTVTAVCLDSKYNSKFYAKSLATSSLVTLYPIRLIDESSRVAA